MQNTKIKFLTAVLLFVIVVFLGYIIFSNNKTKVMDSNITTESDEILQDDNDVVNTTTNILGNKDDLVYLSVKAGQEVGGKLKIKGSVKGAYFFEANILINILDANKNLLKNSHATATSEWMTVEPVIFEGDIDFTNLANGPAYIEIHNDNASGLPEHDKSILIPIIIKN